MNEEGRRWKVDDGVEVRHRHSINRLDVNVHATPTKPTGSRLVRLSGLCKFSPDVHVGAAKGWSLTLQQVRQKFHQPA